MRRSSHAIAHTVGLWPLWPLAKHRDRWWKKWHWSKFFFSEFLRFSCYLSSHHCSILIWPPRGVCDSPNLVAHHILGQVWGFISDMSRDCQQSSELQQGRQRMRPTQPSSVAYYRIRVVQVWLSTIYSHLHPQNLFMIKKVKNDSYDRASDAWINWSTLPNEQNNGE
jgi:hypothetical protein